LNAQKEKGLTASARTLNLLFNGPFRLVKAIEKKPRRGYAFEEKPVLEGGECKNAVYHYSHNA